MDGVKRGAPTATKRAAVVLTNLGGSGDAPKQLGCEDISGLPWLEELRLHR